MTFKAKIRKVGNSFVLTLPKSVYTEQGLKEGIVYTFSVEKDIKEANVYTKPKNIIISPQNVITRFNDKHQSKLCPKHRVNRITCGCE